MTLKSFLMMTKNSSVMLLELAKPIGGYYEIKSCIQPSCITKYYRNS